MYLGNGHKYEQTATYFPLNPPAVLSDPEEHEDCYEPNPSEEPPKSEGDENGDLEEGEEEEDDE